MKIKFLGTRGYLKVRNKKHFRHTSTLIIKNNKKIMIDCGLDWQKKVWKIKPDAIIITHAHPDHAWGLKYGSPCNVWATQESWQVMKKFEIDNKQKKIIEPGKKIKIFGITFEAFSQEHSTLCPAVGYRIKLDSKTIYYSGDIVFIHKRKEALKNVDLYIADGATINRPMIRKNKKTGELFGHTTISAQLTWCKKANIKNAIITHCGSQIVEGGIKAVNKIKELAKERNVKVKVAYDGLTISNFNKNY